MRRTRIFRKTRAAGAAALILAAALLFSACGKETESGETVQTQQASPETAQKESAQADLTKEESKVTANDRYGAALLDALYEESGSNVVVSPVSVNLALAMAAEGAEGETKEEFERFLGVKKDQLDDYVAQILKSVSDTELAKTVISNAFWYLTGQDVSGEFIKTLSERYAAEVSEMDFTDGENAAKIINGWCSEHTNGLIPSIVTPEDVKAQSDLILNTVYFKSGWAEVFMNSYTDTFRGYDKETEADYLSSTESVYYENDKASAFAKPYAQKYSFIGILPKEKGEFTLSDLEIKDLLASKTEAYDVKIKMPKLDFASGGSITEILKDMGIRTAFTDEADFSGIAKDLHLSDVIHKAKLILDENGTEAAAATAVMAIGSAMIPDVKETKTVELDRPYAFLIVDDETGTVLFAGKVTEP